MPARSAFLVGRRRELGVLDTAVDGARHGRGSAAFLLGEAGIGKSRLVNECLYRASAAGLRTLRGRGSPTGADVAFRPLTEALSALMRTGGPPETADLDPYRPALARLVPEWRTATTHRADNLLELSEALLRLLAVLGAQGGTLLALEDLHDADPDTVTVVEYLVDNVADLPVAVVATLRPERGPAADLATAAGQRRAAAVCQLAALTAAETGQIAAACLDVPAEEVPGPVLDRLVRDGAGNPYLIEELLSDMVDSGTLRPADGRWHLDGDLGLAVPPSIVQNYRRRLDRLGPQTRELLITAAVLGQRFALPTLRLVTGHEERQLFHHLRAAADGYFITPDGAAPDWYTFRHALTTDAILAALMPGESASIARAAAATIEHADPEPSDERRLLLADLYLKAGQPAPAARHYAQVGCRALASGATGTAEALLERAHHLAAAAERPVVAEQLIYATAGQGRLDDALTLVESTTAVGAPPLAPARRLAMHTRLAWTAVAVDRIDEATAQVEAARALLPAAAGPEHTAALTVIEAHLVFRLPGGSTPDPRADAERLARLAAEQAEQGALPEVACQALQLLALLARERGFATAQQYLERMLALAEQHDLPVWRVEALLRLGVNDFMRTADTARLRRARQAAFDLGSIMLGHNAESVLALSAVLTAEPGAAQDIIDRCLDATARLRTAHDHRYLLLVAAALAAHHGRRPEMERRLAEFHREGGAGSLLFPLSLGLCRAVCALLEEDRDLATAELAAMVAWENGNPQVYYLSGRYGLHTLLEVLAERADGADRAAAAATPAAELRWNRHFLLLADAVLLGRAERGDDAARAFEAAQAAAAPFPMARALGLRLAAEAALDDGWGEPAAWLRTAEEFFHAAQVPAVVGACRSLLRRSGARVAQRRDGRDGIPAALRQRGVTVREYEVFTQLADRLGNLQIARRLYISPRTVEKHVASLIAKTGCRDRAEVCDYAATLPA
ncbi:AAA family ATPase [Catellatospora sp. KI3]|uniref:helix-turn-helix transcriptional regulator n=1 Tax=Catellatospora sp. KI3 TaxID=3041620 RepID=UPI002482E56E|nr:LuxR family transcriptional regulator [Catellatospora sp. KI3]MDI1465206.1 AAA family ATPase [Catellatospora sp. KI3]